MGYKSQSDTKVIQKQAQKSAWPLIVKPGFIKVG